MLKMFGNIIVLRGSVKLKLFEVKHQIVDRI